MTIESSKPVTVYVTYSGAADARFDRAWYVERHLPLVMSSWSRYGLETITAFFPASLSTTTGNTTANHRKQTLAICECTFRDQAAVDAAFASPEAPAVMADVPHFTDIAPERTRAIPL